MATDAQLPGILVAGIGRMGKGIALAFAYAGRSVALVDSERRGQSAFDELKAATCGQLDRELAFLHEAGALSSAQARAASRRIEVVNHEDAAPYVRAADFVFEAVLEVRDVKQKVYAWLNGHLGAATVVSSTTSTMAADDLAGLIEGGHRFINAHWLNPAQLMPLVEMSPARDTSPETVAAMRSLLEAIGKVPVLCRSSPGFIVSRIQALAMNEAARLVEEGVASVDDVDRAIRAGFGIRFATMGLLEFIDWGGGDILFHATRYLGENIDDRRFSVPRIVSENMASERNGLRDGKGFYDRSGEDIDAYRKEKLVELVKLLEHRGLMPRPGGTARRDGDAD